MACFSLGARFRWALSGTPLANSSEGAVDFRDLNFPNFIPDHIADSTNGRTVSIFEIHREQFHKQQKRVQG
jgi:hypothetical protein